MPLAPGGGRRRQGPRRPCPASRPRALPGPLVPPPDGRQILGCVLVFVVLIRSALPQPLWRPDQSPRPTSFGDRVLEYVVKRDTSLQCLVLSQESDLPSLICEQPIDDRESELRKMNSPRLLHCSAHKVYQALDPQCPWKDGTVDQCRQCFEDLRQRDLATRRRYVEFRELIDKVRCLDTDTFSHQWTCQDCKVGHFRFHFTPTSAFTFDTAPFLPDCIWFDSPVVHRVISTEMKMSWFWLNIPQHLHRK